MSHVVLLGDSIFDNAAYVAGGPDVVEQLRERLPAGSQATLCAVDGAVTRDVTQVQGVWMNPSYRGRGLSAGYMAAVVDLARTLAPVTSLYVNDFNSRARATYERVGFRQVGTFATVLF